VRSTSRDEQLSLEETAVRTVAGAIRFYAMSEACLWTVDEVNEVTTVAEDIARIAVAALRPFIHAPLATQASARGGEGSGGPTDGTEEPRRSVSGY
jgi:hypothetical protein